MVASDDAGEPRSRKGDPGEAPGGWRRAAGLAALLVASTFVALAAAEAGLRLVGFSYPLRAVVVESTGPAPEVLYQRYRLERDLIWVPRDYHQRLARATTDPPDILFLGDSCTEFGLYGGFLLERLNAEGPGDPLTGVNLGVAGWSSHQGLVQVRRDATRIRAPVVTLYYGWNDHWNSIGITDREVSRLMDLPVFRYQALRTVQLLTRAWVALQSRGRDEPPPRVPPERFRRNLEEMAELIRSYGGTPVLLTAPTSHERGREPAYLGERWLTDIDELVPLHRRYADIVREVAAQHQVLLCDLAARFAELPAPRLREELFRDDGIHLRPAGDQVLAGFLEGCLRDGGVLAAPPTAGGRQPEP